jgi:hypothetical protein
MNHCKQYDSVNNSKFKIQNSKLKTFQTKRSALRGLRALWQLRLCPSGAISQDKPRLKWVLHIDVGVLNP